MSDYKIYSGTLPSPVEESIKQVLTSVEYIDGTTAKLNIVGILFSDSIPNKSNLKTVRIGTNVTSIGGGAFINCFELTSVMIPNSVTNIGGAAFANCRSLTSVTILDSVEIIAEYTFSGCSGLTNVTIGNGVTRIGDQAFSDCSGLTSVTIPNNVTSIGEQVFTNCSKLTNILFKGNNPTIGTNAIPSACTLIVDYNSDWKNSVEIPGTFVNCPIKFSEKTIATYESSTEYALATKLFSKGQMFESPSRLMQFICNEQTGMTHDEAITYFKDNTLFIAIQPSFASLLNSAISKITIYTTEFDGFLWLFQNDVFLGSSKKAKQINMTKTGQSDDVYMTMFEFDSSISVTTDSNLHLYLSRVQSISEYPASYEIGVRTNEGEPNSSFCIDQDIDEYPVISITYTTQAKKQFKVEYDVIDEDDFSAISQQVNDCSIVELNLSHNITSIPNGTFQNYTTLRKVILANSISAIGTNAFKDCSQLTSVILRYGITSIGGSAFYGCNSLTSIMIPDSVRTLGSSAFQLCRRLESVTIGNNVENIGSHAFQSCSRLMNVTIPNSIETFGAASFAYCSSITSVTIPDGVTSIGSYAFGGCSGLTSVTIPDGVTSIGDEAFSNCLLLNSVIFEGNRPSTLGTDILQNTASNCIAYVSFMKDWTGETIPSDNFGGSRKIRYIEDAVAKLADGSYCVIDGNDIYEGYLLTKYPRLAQAKSFHLLNPEIETLGYYALSGCTQLTAATFVEGLGGMIEGAFENCSSLTSLTFPSTIYDVDKNVFTGCTGLSSRAKSVTFIGITTYEDLKAIVGNSYIYEVLPEETGLPRSSFNITDNVA